MLQIRSQFILKPSSFISLIILASIMLFSCRHGITAAATQKGLISMKNEQNVVSVQIILPSSSGAKIGPETSITAENIQQFTPSAETIAKATGYFRAKGFDVGNVVGISFTITGAAALFEEVLKVKVVIDDQKAASFSSVEGSKTSSLEGDALKSLPTGLVNSITFPEPLDFGPGNY